jgi:hypothetical protein
MRRRSSRSFPGKQAAGAATSAEAQFTAGGTTLFDLMNLDAMRDPTLPKRRTGGASSDEISLHSAKQGT